MKFNFKKIALSLLPLSFMASASWAEFDHCTLDLGLTGYKTINYNNIEQPAYFDASKVCVLDPKNKDLIQQFYGLKSSNEWLNYILLKLLYVDQRMTISDLSVAAENLHVPSKNLKYTFVKLDPTKLTVDDLNKGQAFTKDFYERYKKEVLKLNPELKFPEYAACNSLEFFNRNAKFVTFKLNTSMVVFEDQASSMLETYHSFDLEKKDFVDVNTLIPKDNLTKVQKILKDQIPTKYPNLDKRQVAFINDMMGTYPIDNFYFTNDSMVFVFKLNRLMPHFLPKPWAKIIAGITEKINNSNIVLELDLKKYKDLLDPKYQNLTLCNEPSVAKKD